MKGKLIKEVFGGQVCYTLFKDGEKTPYAKDGKGHGYMLLSVKNCEAIANGYDLDEFVKEEFTPSIENKWGLDNWSNEVIYYSKEGFVTGFQKALEVRGDKKFDAEDILIAIESGYHAGINHNVDEEEQGDKIIRLKDNVIASLQQSEFDVEIVTKPYTEVSEGFFLAAKREPKLDKNNCLILKPIKNV